MTTDSTIPKENRLESILDSLLFVSEHPLPLSRMVEILETVPETEILSALSAMQSDRGRECCGVELKEVAGGWQYRTRAENSPWIFRLNKARPVRLSRAALETLSIVAYRQPVTRPEVDEIRGVDSGQVLRNLLERNFVRILGKREEPGSPLIYGTTREFLEFFGLRNLTDLPTLREYTELGEESRAKLERLLPDAPSDAALALVPDISQAEDRPRQTQTEQSAETYACEKNDDGKDSTIE